MKNKVVLAILMLFFLCACHAVKPAFVASKKLNRVLILGNSITRHAPSARLGWAGDWGMAASSIDKDFVHLLMKDFQQVDPSIKVDFKNVADYERGYWTYDLHKMDSLITLKPNLIILRIGENINAKTIAENNFTNHYSELVRYFKAQLPGVRILFAASFWNKDEVDKCMEDASVANHIYYLKLSQLSADKSNSAEGLFKDKGVAAHPSDKGMAAIADAIWNKLKQIY